MKKTLLILAVTTFFAAAAMAQTGDPWIRQIYRNAYNRDPTAIEYNIHNYNDGKWNSYDELQHYVAVYKESMKTNGITTKISDKTFANNTRVVGFFKDGQLIAADLITNDGGSIVAQGGGNIIAQGGGNIVAQGGGNIVAQGGGNISVNNAVKGAGFSNRYTIQEAGATVIQTSGNGSLVIH